MKIINNLPKNVDVLNIAESTLQSAKEYADTAISAAIATKIVTVPASSWTASGNYFVNTVSVDGIAEGDYPLFGLAPTSGDLYSDTELAAYNDIIQLIAGANSLTFYSNSQPTVDLKIVVK